MSAPRVLVVDYGLGNLHSVGRALEAAGAAPFLSSDPADIAAASLVVLPGVGSFGDGMRGLTKRGLVEPLRRHAASGRPLMGLCLGMQLLLGRGTEFGDHEGLGIIPGSVVPLEALKPAKVPHIGWSGLAPAGWPWTDTPLSGLSTGVEVYFVHSFVAKPDRPEHVLAECEYGGVRFCAVVSAGRVAGCQFHPEKSGPYGLAILRNFVHQEVPVDETLR